MRNLKFATKPQIRKRVCCGFLSLTVLFSKAANKTLGFLTSEFLVRDFRCTSEAIARDSGAETGYPAVIINSVLYYFCFLRFSNKTHLIEVLVRKSTFPREIRKKNLQFCKKWHSSHIFSSFLINYLLGNVKNCFETTIFITFIAGAKLAHPGTSELEL